MFGIGVESAGAVDEVVKVVGDECACHRASKLQVFWAKRTWNQKGWPQDGIDASELVRPTVAVGGFHLPCCGAPVFVGMPNPSDY